MSPSFNANMLLIARHARNINQEELANRIGIAQGHLSKIENKLFEPTDDIIQNMSNALNLPANFFFQEDRIYGLPLSVHPMHRKKASTGQRNLDRIDAEINIKIMQLRRLLKAINFNGRYVIPKIYVDEYDGDIEHIANLVRRTWLLPRGPLANLTECIEQAGGIIIWCDFSGVSVDAVSYQIPDLPPFIFVNKKQPADRMRFTIAHELGHLVLHGEPSKEMENEADRFASALLMPAQDIKPHLIGKISIKKLAQLKPIWRVSMQAIAMRAKSIGVINENQSRYIWQQFNKLNYRMKEPPELDFPYEIPRSLSSLLNVHMEKLGYSIAELAKALHIYPSELAEMYNFEGSPLRDRRLKVVS